MRRAGLLLLLIALLAACAGERPPRATTAGDEAKAAVGLEAPAPPGALPAPPPPPPAAPAGPVAPVAASEPAGLAAQLTAAEHAVRDETVTGPALAEAGHLQQVAYSRLADSPEWLDAVLAEVPPPLHTAVHRNLGASLELRRLSGTPPTSLPSWEIVAPEPAETLLGHYREAEGVFAVPWQYLAAIHLVETRMGRIRGTSSAGAQGPMQFMPATWAQYGEGDVHANRDAILAAGRYLSARGAPADMPRALYAYNNSNRYVRAVAYYADVMRDDPRAYRGYYSWQVYYAQPGGPVWLPEGYPALPAMPPAAG